jgi:RecA-family ATPase
VTRRARLITAGEILAAPDPNDWIVKPLLVGGSTMMLYGRPGYGKTTLAMQLAAALAGGAEDWLRFPVAAHGDVVWLQLDMPRPELKRMLERAIKRWPCIAEHVHFFQMLHDDVELSEVNVLHGDAELLAAEVARLRPIALFVDTASDTYVADASADLNQQVRRVVRAYRTIAQGGAVVYLQHQRKRAQGAVGDDQDSYLGGMAWSGIATTVWHLAGSRDDEHEKFWLYKRKNRLAALHFDKLDLDKDGEGFFAAKWSAKAALLAWPELLPADQSASSRTDIMQALSQHYGLDGAALRQALHRLPAHERPTWA